ncbi:MAG: multiheme c-type cytochrome [Planctomycetaceae bacterium]
MVSVLGVGCADIGARVARRGQPSPSPIARTNKAPAKRSPSNRQQKILRAHAVSHSGKKPTVTPAVALAIDKAHAACFEKTAFPSAKKCAECHPQHYREWSVSPHAYAQISPVFNTMSNKLIELNTGTLGDFCIRCHTPVGMALNEKINMSNLDRHPTAREGVTCVVCHRINQAWGKGAGRQALTTGDIHAPVTGPIGSELLEQVLANPDKYSVLKTEPNPNIKGRDVHSASQRFFQMTTPGFCGSCHDVFAPNGFRLEDAFSEFKQSPSARGMCKENCNDCHMGKVPGRPDGYDVGPAAIVGNAKTPARKHTNHMIVGPDYSIVHPAIFPHNPKAIREEHEDPNEFGVGLATIREWLLFDHRSDWGKPHFERTNPDPKQFPEPWKDPLRRQKARRILNDQQKLLDEATAARVQILREGYRLSEIQDIKADRKGVHFKVKVSNGTRGHGVPTGFDAERVVFLRVMVWDANGKLVFQSGDLDPNGDLRDSHSFYVHDGKLPLDRQLFSLQSRFITRNVRGGEREQIVPVPYSLDPLPYQRPTTRPFTVLGRPMGARKHKQNIEPNGHAWAKYRIAPEQLTGCGPYVVRVQLIAGMVPVNLVHLISSVGFDYGMSAREVATEVVRGHLVLWERKAVISPHR